MEKSTFVYVTFIRTTPEKLWAALTQPEFTRQFFFDTVQECEWKVGSPWKIVAPDGATIDSGEVLEVDPPKHLVLKWRNEYKPEAKAEGYSRMTYTLEAKGDMVKFTVLHEMDKGQSVFIQQVSNGWPIILSSLKTLLETGESLEETRSW
ncbi:MAG: SRPBCC family protein [Chthoniobacterales bacterium]